MKNKYIVLLGLIFFNIIFKFSIVFNSEHFGHQESCIRSVMARELIRASNLDPEHFLLIHDFGGAIVISYLYIPFILLFGDLAYLIFPFTLSLLTLLIIYFSMIYFFNTKTAVFAALLFIFSTPLYSIFSFIANGAYTESIFFSIGILFLFLYISKREDKPLLYALLGLICGFSIFFYMINLIAVSYIFLFLLVRKSFFSKKFYIFFLFFLIGLIPFILIDLNLSNSIFLETVVNGFLNFSITNLYNIFIKFISFFTYDFISSFLYHLFFLFRNIIFSYFYYFISLIIVLYFFWTKTDKNTKTYFRFFFLFFIYYIFIYSISSFYLDYSDAYLIFPHMIYRYVLVLHPVLFLLVSIAVSYTNKKLVILLYILLVAFGLIGNISLISGDSDYKYVPYCYYRAAFIYGASKGDFSDCDKFEKWFRPSCYTGVYAEMGMYSTHNKLDNISKSIIHCQSMESTQRSFCYQGIAYSIGSSHFGRMFNEEDCLNLDNDFSPYCYFGLGIGIGNKLKPAEAIKSCEKLLSENRVYCYLGIGNSYESNRFAANTSLLVTECKGLDSPLKEYCFSSLPFFHFHNYFKQDITLCDGYDEEYKPFCYHYYGKKFSQIFGLKKMINECNKLDEYNQNCIEGITDYISFIYLVDKDLAHSYCNLLPSQKDCIKKINRSDIIFITG